MQFSFANPYHSLLSVVCKDLKRNQQVPTNMWQQTQPAQRNRSVRNERNPSKATRLPNAKKEPKQGNEWLPNAAHLRWAAQTRPHGQPLCVFALHTTLCTCYAGVNHNVWLPNACRVWPTHGSHTANPPYHLRVTPIITVKLKIF